MNPLIADFRYRPEIDGLRAIAVVPVVLFHAGLGVPGGYIGVDVFFVISGYLITSLVVNGLESDRFTLAGFWERRARRILPAMLPLVLATLVAGWFLMLPSDYASLGRSAAWQAVFSANIHFWRETSYFAGGAEESPLLHTWSLAVEEQFYMVVPLLLLGLFQIPVFRRRPILLSLIGGGIVASLGASIYGVARHPSATFYWLPTRAWELLCGAFVALTPPTWRFRSSAVREGLSILGLAGALVPCWLYSKTTPFPGLAAVPPCLGTAIFIWVTDTAGPKAHFPMAARLLASRPVVFIGLISYSLYLWHWPLVAFGAYLAPEPLSVGYRLGLVGAGLGLAVVSWHFVETPFRTRRLCADQSAMLALGFAALLAVFGLGEVVWWVRGFPARLPGAAVEYAEAKEDGAGIHALTAEDVRARRLVVIGDARPELPVSLLLWGDSHAMAAAPAFDQFLRENHLAGRQATAASTAPVLDAYWQNEFTNPGEVHAFNEAVFDYIRQQRIPNVVLSAFWEYYTDERGSTPLDSSLLTTIQRLVNTGTRPWVLLQVPHPRVVVPRALALASVFGYDLNPWLAKPNGWNGLRGTGDSLLERTRMAGAGILDPRPCFLDVTRQRYIVQRNGKSLYRDAHHLSATGSRMILVPFLRSTLGKGAEPCPAA